VTPIVVDASVAVKWVVEEDGWQAAAALRGRHRFLAPNLLIAETTNILWKKAQRGELSRAVALVACRALALADIEFHDMRALADAALQLATAMAHPAYDCFYIALAQKEGIPFLTADTRLAGKAVSHAGLLPELRLLG
jgi:predicted nucleic acid-binding protein